MTKELNFFMINNSMKKVKAFFYVFLKSLIPQKKYYQHLIRTPFKFSFKYFVSLVIFLNLIFIIGLINRYSYKKIVDWLYGIRKTLSEYPPNLLIFVKNGYLYTNINHPYFFWLKINDKKKLLVSVIETTDKKIINDLHSPLVLTKDQLIVKNPNNYQTVSVFKLRELPEFAINRQLTYQAISIIDLFVKNLFWYFLIAVFLTVLFLPLISFLITSLYLLIASVLVFLYFKFFEKRHFHFKKVFQISFHAITLPLTLKYLIIILPINLFLFKKYFFTTSSMILPFLVVVTFTLFTLIGVLKAYNHRYLKQ